MSDEFTAFGLPTGTTSGTSAAGDDSRVIRTQPLWTAADHGLLTWTVDPVSCSGTQVATAGILYVQRVHLPVASSVTNIVMNVVTAGVTLTSGRNFAALYTAAGALVAITADQTTNWQSTGNKSMALAGGPYSLAAGDWYLAWWCNGTTPPAMARTSVVLGSLANVNLAAPNMRCATANTSVTTTAPDPMGTQSLAAVYWWMALS